MPSQNLGYDLLLKLGALSIAAPEGEQGSHRLLIVTEFAQGCDDGPPRSGLAHRQAADERVARVEEVAA